MDTIEQNKISIPIQERVKTFEDACKELGEEHPLVKQWRVWKQAEIDIKATEAYLKLCIITAALNEGWEPELTEGEWRYLPYLVLYTKEEFHKMNKKQKDRVIKRSYNHTSDYGIAVYGYVGADSSCTYSNRGIQFAYKSKKLAEYAGKQFVDIYAEFIWK